MLCTVCNIGIRDKLRHRGKHSDHHRTIDELMQAARSGCHICTEISEDVHTKLGRRGKCGQGLICPFLLQMCYLNNSPILTYRVWTHPQNDFEFLEWKFELVLDPSPIPGRSLDELNRENKFLSRDIPSTTRSSAVGALANSWLSQCARNHDKCRLHKPQQYCPLRLIDLDFQRPRLVLAKDLRRSVEYAVLSHCWGVEPFLVLTQDQIPTYQKEGFSLSELPLNFRDVIQICRWLRIRYLWIDSLCIIQSGSKYHKDWARHVHIMRRIYASAILCISTAAATKATETCLKDRDPRAVQSVIVEDNNQVYVPVSQHHIERGFLKAPIAERGWILQERLFSRRILTIGRQQLFWECKESIDLCVSETFPFGIPIQIRQHKLFSLPGLPNKKAFKESNNYREWLDLIQIYSHCKLSFPNQDKFAAFSGVAESMSKLFRSPPYIAGFFLPEFPMALIWSIPEEHRPQSQPLIQSGVYRSPSWSWAATDSPVNYSGWSGTSFGKYDYTTLTSYSCVPANPNNPFGQLLYAEITLKTTLVPVSWETDGEDCFVRFLDPRLATVTVPFTTFHTDCRAFAMDCLDFYTLPQDGICLLPIYSCVGISGLLVRPVTSMCNSTNHSKNLEKKIYMRVGIFQIKESSAQSVFDRADTMEVILVWITIGSRPILIAIDIGTRGF